MTDTPTRDAEATVGDLLAWGQQRLAGCRNPALEAALLLGHCLGRGRAWLYTWPERAVTAAARRHYRDLLDKRARGVPVAHLLGEREFWSLTLRVTAETLIPRAETETLVSAALSVMGGAAPVSVLDLGTGSGAVGLALASEWPHTAVTGTETSSPAAAVARDNARRLGLDRRFRVYEGDWFAAVIGLRFPLIVANPPYIDAAEPEPWRGDAAYEPRQALIAGQGGLAALRTIIAGARDHLQPGGWLMLEHGWCQAAPVRDALARAGFAAVGTWQDLAGHQRVSGGRLPDLQGPCLRRETAL